MGRAHESAPAAGQGPHAPAPFSVADVAFMVRALWLGGRALGATAPNPMVGSVVVRDGQVVGEGFHRRCGAAHAEAIALENAGTAARGATLYASLEPCAHVGRTPPCVDGIVAAGITRVVIPALDPDRRVRGRGIEKLRDAGIRVDLGCLSAEAIAQNASYYRDRLGMGATVTLKMAVSLDGRIARARGQRDDVTGPAARRYVHRLRAAHDCVVVGVETAIIDRPRLDCRYLETSDADPVTPIPVVLDTHLRMPLDNRWAVDGREYIVLCGPDAASDRAAALEAAGARVLRTAAREGRVSIRQAIALLDGAGLGRILVEGGAEVFSSFVREGAWHVCTLLQAPVAFGDVGVPMFTDGAVIGGVDAGTEALGDDTRRTFANGRALPEIVSRLGKAT